ncbi:MAG: ABC transporter ATP-binding protein [Gammaproteobacteria bacterium]
MTLSHLAPGISLSDASLRFEHKLLFENLALELTSGTITCLLGPSGVGKTTLLRMIAGLPLFGRGEDKLQALPHKCSSKMDSRLRGNDKDLANDRDLANDKDLNNPSHATITTTDGLPLAGRIAYMGQTDLLLPWLNVLDNVLLGSFLRGQRRDIKQQAHALHILESVGLAAEIHHKPATLSGGMKQRVALARTLMEDKPVVLMDEPFSALDAITRYDMQALAAIKLTGKTVLLITHDPWEALRLGHQILVLRGQPATLSQPIMLPTSPPRDITDAALLPLQKLLLSELQMVSSV